MEGPAHAGTASAERERLSQDQARRQRILAATQAGQMLLVDLVVGTYDIGAQMAKMDQIPRAYASRAARCLTSLTLPFSMVTGRIQ